LSSTRWQIKCGFAAEFEMMGAVGSQTLYSNVQFYNSPLEVTRWQATRSVAITMLLAMVH
jgi:hypothetical protein